MSNNQQPQVIVVKEKGIGCMGAIFWAVIIVGAIGVAAQSLPKSTKPVE
jgi:hypothetical protein